jgi:hypothetical protein
MAVSKSKQFAGICLVLALVTLILYWPVTGHQFINLDDAPYITHNPHVQSGLTWRAIVWAFQTGYAGNWHPVTWISHMIDCQIFGLNPAGHHLVSLLFHIANILLLFLLLNQMTGALWRSAFVAAVFAWHPLRVESVAWAAERRDVLSSFFWIVTTMAYVRFVEKADSQTPKAKGLYWLALVFFALGLMSKPMLVTLPFTLLLLDVWPLGRVRLTGSATAECVAGANEERGAPPEAAARRAKSARFLVL